MNILSSFLALSVSFSLNTAHAADHPGWADSYEVGGKCYCIIAGSGAFDHGIADVEVNGQTIRDICEALGTGAEDGRTYYNDIQCGNGPANDSADETVCPGIPSVGNDSGPDCNQKGPTWSLTPASENNDEMAEEEETTQPEEDNDEMAEEEETTQPETGDEDCDCDDLSLDENDPFGDDETETPMPVGEEDNGDDAMPVGDDETIPEEGDDENTPTQDGGTVGTVSGSAGAFSCEQVVFGSSKQYVCK